MFSRSSEGRTARGGTAESQSQDDAAVVETSREPKAGSREPGAESQQPTADSRLALGLLLLLTGIGWLLSSGHTYARDDETMFVSAESLLDLGQFAIPEGVPVINVARGVDGRQYSSYGPVMTLAIVPFILVGRALAGTLPVEYYGYFGRLGAGLLNPFAHALAATLIFMLARLLGYRPGVSVSLALIFSFSTWEWPHSRTGFSEPLTIVWILLAVYCVARSGQGAGGRGQGAGGKVERQARSGELRAASYERRAGSGEPGAPNKGESATENRHSALSARPLPTAQTPLPTRSSALSTQHSSPGWAFAGGVAAAMLVSTRIQEAVVLPLLFGYLAWASWRGFAPDRRAAGVRLGAWGAGLVLGIVPLMIYQAALFGNPLRPAYGNTGELFMQERYVAIYGWLLASGVGVLWFAPALWLSAIAWPRFWRSHRPQAVFFAALIGIHALLYSGYPFWWGGGAWGPRYLAPALPFMLLPLAALWEPGRAGAASWFAEGSRRLRSATVALLVLAGFVTQAGGVLVNLDTYITMHPDDLRHFEPYYSPLAGHQRLLRSRVEQWAPAILPPRPGFVLAKGFSYSEGEDGAPLPRWTLARARIRVHTGAEPASIRLKIADHRPPEYERARWSLLLNGSPADAEITSTGGVGDEKLAVVPVPARSDPAVLEIAGDTWNPGDRDEPIGVYVTGAEMDSGGKLLRPVALPQIPVMPTRPQGRFGWFLRSDVEHLADHWLWYMSRSGLPQGSIEQRAAALIAVCVAAMTVGVFLLWGGARRVIRDT